MKIWLLILVLSEPYATIESTAATIAECERRAPIVAETTWRKLYLFRMDLEPGDVTVNCVRSESAPVALQGTNR